MSAYIMWALAFCAFIAQFVASRLWISFDCRGVCVAAIEITIVAILVYASAGQVAGLTILWSLVLGQLFGYLWMSMVVFIGPSPARQEIAPEPALLPDHSDRPYAPGQLFDRRF